MSRHCQLNRDPDKTSAISRRGDAGDAVEISQGKIQDGKFEDAAPIFDVGLYSAVYRKRKTEYGPDRKPVLRGEGEQDLRSPAS